MMLLPKKVGPFTLMRKLGTDGVTESYVAILDEPAGKQVVVRRVLPWISRDAQRLAEFEARVKDLLAVRHDSLVPLLDLVVVDDERYVVEEWLDAVDLEQVVAWLRERDRHLPHNIFLNLATQICNGLEALHSRPGAESGSESVLHMAMRPCTVFLSGDGRVVVGDYGLTRSPTSIPAGGLSMPLTSRMEYLAPEQTHQDQKLAPSSDIFSLGALLYELLTLQPMFRAESNLQTIHRVRRAEVTTQLLEVKELLPGLDKVLYRALSLNPRHRYQRAFVLREDLRGLMAGFSFSNIQEQMREFLGPLFENRGYGLDEVVPSLPAEGPGETTAALLEAVGEPVTQPGAPASVPSGSGGLPLNVASDRDGPSPPAGPLPDDTAGLLRLAGYGQQAPVDAVASHEDDSVTDMRVPPLEAPPPDGSSTSWFEQPQPERAGPAPGARPLQPALDTAQPERDRAERPALHTIDLSADSPERADDRAAAPQAPSMEDTHLRDGGAPQPSRPRSEPARAQPTPQRRDEYTDDLEEDGASAAPMVVAALGLVAFAGLSLICVGIGGAALLAGGGGDADPPTLAAAAAPGTPEVAVVEEAPPPEPEPEPVAAAPRPKPPPARSAPSPSPSPSPSVARTSAPRPAAPSPVPSMQPAPSVQPAPIAAAAVAAPPPPPPMPAFDEADLDPVADVDDGALETLVAEVGDLDDYSRKAHGGSLSSSERDLLGRVDRADPDRFTRAQVLLYLDAKARGDLGARRSHLASVMSLPENQYRPELLVEQAELAMRDQDYAVALERARLAERHWGRLPSDLVFSRKVMIYEIEASAHTGLFYRSDGEQLESLHGAIRAWEKYRQHAATHQRQDLLVRADQQLAKLHDMQRRLE